MNWLQIRGNGGLLYFTSETTILHICTIFDLGTCHAGSSFSTELQEKDTTEEQCH
jgi:hypothetical protein